MKSFSILAQENTVSDMGGLQTRALTLLTLISASLE